MIKTGSEDPVHLDALRVLTAAARRTDDHRQPLDYAGFLALVIASVAANVGGPERLLAGRSGSWESSHLEGLIRGTVGEDSSDLLRLRTEPVIVPLNVAQLIENGDHHDGLVGLDYVPDKINSCYEFAEDDQELIKFEQETAAAVSRYELSYRTYGASFAEAVGYAAEAVGLNRDLLVVAVDDDPMSTWWSHDATRNPVEWEWYELIIRLWNYAHDVVKLPNVDIRLRTHDGNGADDHD